MILVLGDSWGCGEWIEGKNTHGGLAEYLRQDGYFVINLSKPGGSNLHVVDTLFSFCNNNSGIEKIFIFQTEWYRDLITENVWSKEFCNIYKNHPKKLKLQIKDQIIARYYHNLAIIYEKYNIPIFLIGGISDIDYFPDFEKTYKGINPICKSSVNLVLQHTDEIEEPVTSLGFRQCEAIFETIKQNCNSNKDLEEFIDELTKNELRAKTLIDNPEYFPDSMHGGRLFHKIIFDFLKTKKVI